ncbi:cytochrome c oxidase assembly factor 1 [[Candida] anglica]|uniref:Cytochrome c oxidase assembly factor 1 n=1 Tax=[Candida] anglica TaxID=148631 RepID=A0ABP0EFG5_9ASCO
MLARGLGRSTNILRTTWTRPVVRSLIRTLSTEAPRVVSIDRELPDPFQKKKQNRYYFVCYGLGVTLSCIFIFNYEKTMSPITNSVMYFLRRSHNASEVLGDDITFASQWPWIWGPLNAVKGDVDIEFDVKGTKGTGTLKLRATRESKQVPFHVHHWTLDVKDGESTRTVDLLKDSSVEFGI